MGEGGNRMSFARKMQRNKQNSKSNAAKGTKVNTKSRRDWYIRTATFRLQDDRHIIVHQHRNFYVTMYESDVPQITKGSKFLACIQCSSPMSRAELFYLVRTYFNHNEKLSSRMVDMNAESLS